MNDRIPKSSKYPEKIFIKNENIKFSTEKTDLAISDKLYTQCGYYQGSKKPKLLISILEDFVHEFEE